MAGGGRGEEDSSSSSSSSSSSRSSVTAAARGSSNVELLKKSEENLLRLERDASVLEAEPQLLQKLQKAQSILKLAHQHAVLPVISLSDIRSAGATRKL
jgi:hypothetical protein